MFELRPHQLDTINQLRRTWKTSRTHQIYAPVGFGKTFLAYYIIKAYVERGERVLFVAPYTMLVEQTAARFMEYGLHQPGIIWQNHEWTDRDNLVQIASVDTLIRRDFPDDIALLICDESHIKRVKMLDIISDSDFPVIGLSGTPYPEWMGSYYKNLVKTTTMREMIDIGALSEFEIYAPSHPNLKGVKTTNLAGFGKDYLESAIAEIMGDAKIVGDIVGNWVDHGENRPTIAFCCNVAHANHITIEFNRAGVKAEVMVADTPKEEREQIIARFEDGITKIICNVGVLTAGFDSDVRCIIYARPTKSEIRWIQCLGRGLRPAKGKDNCLIFDHSGTVHRLGFPDSIEYDELLSESDGKKQAERKKKQEEKKEKLPKECSKCDYMKEAGIYVCPRCGFKPIAGEDVETDLSRGLTSLKSKPKITTEQKQLFYSELLGYQQEHAKLGRFISDGYIAHTYRDKFGVWPKGLDKKIKQPSASVRGFIKHKNIKFAKSKAKR